MFIQQCKNRRGVIGREALAVILAPILHEILKVVAPFPAAPERVDATKMGVSLIQGRGVGDWHCVLCSGKIENQSVSYRESIVSLTHKSSRRPLQ
jgi:hypothetical protein